MFNPKYQTSQRQSPVEYFNLECKFDITESDGHVQSNILKEGAGPETSQGWLLFRGLTDKLSISIIVNNWWMCSFLNVIFAHQ